MRDRPRAIDDLAGSVLQLPTCPTFSRPANADLVSSSERIDLDRLRWMAVRSQLAPRPDLERACFLLVGAADVSFERLAIAFFRGLSLHARRPMTLYRPGTKAVSDDEAWLVRLVTAWRSGLQSQAGALLAWRVEPKSQRWLRFLSSAMVGAMDAAR